MQILRRFCGKLDADMQVCSNASKNPAPVVSKKAHRRHPHSSRWSPGSLSSLSALLLPRLLFSNMRESPRNQRKKEISDGTNHGTVQLLNLLRLFHLHLHFSVTIHEVKRFSAVLLLTSTTNSPDATGDLPYITRWKQQTAMTTPCISLQHLT